MGCSCLKSNLVIKSKVQNKDILPQDINNIQPQPLNLISKNNINNNNNNNNLNPQLNQYSQHNPPNPSPIPSSIPLNNNSNIPSHNIFSNFEPYLISKNDPSFNYPEVPNEYAGHGLKLMKGYISHITLSELNKVREDFWSSRVEGDKEIWELLHAVCSDQSLTDGDITEMLKISGVIPYRDCINVVYDSKGAIYEIPNYCINDPLQYNIPEIEYTKEKPQEQKINIILRSFDINIKCNISNWKSISNLKEFLLTQEGYKTININNVRFFYGGKELLNEKELWFYDIMENSIVQMLIKKEEKKEESYIEGVGGKKIKTSIAIGNGSEEISYEKQEQKILLIDNDDKKSRDSQDGQRDTGFDKKDRE